MDPSILVKILRSTVQEKRENLASFEKLVDLFETSIAEMEKNNPIESGADPVDGNKAGAAAADQPGSRFEPYTGL